jgi:carbonic anhydrase
MSAPFRPVLRCTALAGLLVLLAAPLQASDNLGSVVPRMAPPREHKAPIPRGEASAPAETEAKAAKAPAPMPPGRDPMDVLRERLAEKLGAAKAPQSPSPYVMQVTSKSESGDAHAPAAATAAAASAKPAAKPAHKAAPAGDANELVGKLRAEKAAARTPDGHSPHWSYDGSAGPEAWARLNPEFAKCSTGQRQSPIDIRGGIKVDLDPVQFDYKPVGFGVVDNGHTVQVNVGSGNAIEVQGRRYDLVQFHFHRPSEERIDGRQFDMVAHLVHKDSEGRLAVVAVLLDRGSAHAVVQQVWNNLPLEKGEQLDARTPIDLSALLPADRRYYTYMGSLTTPPCSEGVLWMVMQQPVTISQSQINIFAKLYPMNARPIQSAAGRLIKQSN